MLISVSWGYGLFFNVHLCFCVEVSFFFAFWYIPIYFHPPPQLCSRLFTVLFLSGSRSLMKSCRLMRSTSWPSGLASSSLHFNYLYPNILDISYDKDFSCNKCGFFHYYLLFIGNTIHTLDCILITIHILPLIIPYNIIY